MIQLVDVREVAPVAREVIERFGHDFADELGDAEVHHIGATSLPFGHTKSVIGSPDDFLLALATQPDARRP